MYQHFLLLVLSYLLGSIPSAVLISHWMGLPDPRSIGSGNPGATNVLRSGSKWGAGLTLLADAIKGIPAVLWSIYLGFQLGWVCAIAFAALLGHMYSVFLKFHGGKGVATTLGILLILYWPIGLTWAGIWLFVAKVLGYSSVAALLATAMLVPMAWWIQLPRELVFFLLALTVMVFWRHRQNIKNLLSGNETRIHN